MCGTACGPGTDEAVGTSAMGRRHALGLAQRRAVPSLRSVAWPERDACSRVHRGGPPPPARRSDRRRRMPPRPPARSAVRHGAAGPRPSVGSLSSLRVVSVVSEGPTLRDRARDRRVVRVVRVEVLWAAQVPATGPTGYSEYCMGFFLGKQF
jgi:hypothetical protein